MDAELCMMLLYLPSPLCSPFQIKEGTWFDDSGRRKIITQYHEVVGFFLGPKVQVRLPRETLPQRLFCLHALCQPQCQRSRLPDKLYKNDAQLIAVQLGVSRFCLTCKVLQHAKGKAQEVVGQLCLDSATVTGALMLIRQEK